MTMTQVNTNTDTTTTNSPLDAVLAQTVKKSRRSSHAWEIAPRQQPEAVCPVLGRQQEPA
jgi:hypothetical protein